MEKRTDKPKDYTEVYRRYFSGPNSEAKKIVRGILRYATEDELEHLPHDIFSRLFEHHILEKFDPSKVPNGKFAGAVYFVARSVCINHLNKKGRNPITGLHGGSLSDHDSEEFEKGAYSLESHFAAPAPNIDEEMDRRQIIALLKYRLEAMALGAKEKNKREKSLILVLQMLEQDKDPKEIAQALGVTGPTVYNYMLALKEEAQKEVELLQPPKKTSKTGQMMLIEKDPGMPIEEE